MVNNKKVQYFTIHILQLVGSSLDISWLSRSILVVDVRYVRFIGALMDGLTYYSIIDGMLELEG
jgi:hypothetical protein